MHVIPAKAGIQNKLKSWIPIFIGMTVLSFSLSACEIVRSQPPAPVTNLGTNLDSIYGGMLVRSGETVGAIAQRYNLPVRDIIDINNLQPPYRLAAGQRLKLPPPLEHKVSAHDTLYTLAKMYNVPLSELVRTNDLRQPYSLKIGQVLRIPSSVLRQREWSATAFGAPEMPATQPAPIRVELLPTPTAVIPKPPASQPVYQPPSDLVAAATRTSAPVQQPLQTTVLGSERPDFVWPLRGKIISSYGSKEGQLFNDGINIAAPRGTPVAAAADGIVAYVGSDLGSYGNLVLIRHSGGMVTAYAHLGNVAVKKDAIVKKGQAIGSVGSTGNVSNAQLHFEIRKGRETFDPVKYL